MAIRKSVFNIKGMTRDMAVSKFSSEYAFENKNLRIIATDENTSFGLVNERGTAPMSLYGLSSNYITGTPIGQEVINNQLILFTTNSNGTDKIYKFNLSFNEGQPEGYLYSTELYTGDLNFDSEHPIECISIYEDEQLQNVYWTDGKNQPRVINIAADTTTKSHWNADYFNFARNIGIKGKLSVQRDDSAAGSFAAGVIQYCFTYYDMYGPESPIVYTSPLSYISHQNRGGKPDDIISCAFKVTLSSGDYNNNFDYIRLYSIQRTSLNATPIVRKVADIGIRGRASGISYIDTGEGGEAVDPTTLLYVGSEKIVAETIAQKDNTLFLGNITAPLGALPSSIKSTARSSESITYSAPEVLLSLPDNRSVGQYGYTSQLVGSNNNSNITYFKKGETYRLGFQAQHNTGKWSEVVFLKDYTMGSGIANSDSGMNIRRIRAVISDTSILQALFNAGYIKIRPMVVFPEGAERVTICQGVLCPTVYNVEDRYTNSPFAQSSWFFRPIPPGEASSYANTGNVVTQGKWAEFRHNYPIPSNDDPNAEIQCIYNPPNNPAVYASLYEPHTEQDWVADNKECFFVDQSIVTLHSPDIEFEDTLKNFESDDVGIRIVGYVPIDAQTSDIDIIATAPMNYIKGYSSDKYDYYPTVAPGFVKPKVAAATGSGNGWRCLLSGPMWFDELSNHKADNILKLPVGFVVYPWHRNGALNNARAGTVDGDLPSRLLHKKMSITRFSKNSIMLGSATTLTDGVSSAATFSSDELSMVRIKAPDNSGISDITYYGNVDKLVSPHNRYYNYHSGEIDTDGISGQIALTGWGSNLQAGAAYPIIIADPGNASLLNDSSYTSRTVLSNPEFTDLSSTDWALDLLNVRAVRNTTDIFKQPYEIMAYQSVETRDEVDYAVEKRYIFKDSPTRSTDPVSIKYKSTPHIVLALNQASTSKQTVLPRANTYNSVAINKYPTVYSNTPGVFWKSSITGINQTNITISPAPTTGFLWLADLYRKTAPSNIFGGTGEDAIENNVWIPAGEPVVITNGTGTAALSSVTITWTQGDTYYQRYDCLKTYPFTMEDQNSVVDILSFMCETRVNIDGRCDKNRGSLSNLYTTPATFNLFNPVYSQKNNFFNYRSIGRNKITSDRHPNLVTWTKTKTLGETVDTWANITLASTLNLDGDKGSVRALRRFNNDILAFQDGGISQILYNENMQITTTAGVPIEIANSGKVSGKRYISNHIGCVNKWSICAAPAGVYFMDDIGKDIYLFDGKLNNISDRYGFHSWVISNFDVIRTWNPKDFLSNMEISYYDKTNGDVMFITGDTCLSFSEPLGSFSSFYSYEKTPFFSQIKNVGIMWHVDDSLPSNDANYGKYRAWSYERGPYNSFFGVYKPFYTTVIANEHPTEDKVFDNIEYRGDTFKYGSTGVNDTIPEGTYLHDNTFDRLETWNEYQHGIASLTDVKDWGSSASNLKKKFRIWRAQIPRNTENKGGTELINYTRDRMRNPWLYIKLSKETANTNQSILHDLAVLYFE